MVVAVAVVMIVVVVVVVVLMKVLVLARLRMQISHVGCRLLLGHQVQPSSDFSEESGHRSPHFRLYTSTCNLGAHRIRSFFVKVHTHCYVIFIIYTTRFVLDLNQPPSSLSFSRYIPAMTWVGLFSFYRQTGNGEDMKIV